MPELDEPLAKAEAELAALTEQREAQERRARARIRPALDAAEWMRADVEALREHAARLETDLRDAEKKEAEPLALSARALVLLPLSWGALLFAALETPDDAARLVALGGLAACALFVAGVGRGR